MEKIRIRGGADLSLKGNVRVSGSKNAVLPAIAASLLTGQSIRLTNVPLVRDVYSMLTLLRELGADCDLRENVLELRAEKLRREEASYDLVRVMRASILVLGPLVARFGRAVVALPGGCAIGSRPIDLHIAALHKLGASISLEHGYIKAEASRLQGTEIHFEKTTVGGTENLVMAASLARGETVLRNCAREPEVQGLCELLIKMGANIDGVGEETIRIKGVESLDGANHEIIPDRIEAGTYMVAGALTKGDIVLCGVRPDHLITTIEKLRSSGARVDILESDKIRVVGAAAIHPQDITTSPFPGFPTDMQAQFMVLMTQASGTSIITETIFDRRFQHVNELLRLGASIEVSGDKAIVRGPTPLSGAEVTASDLRASAGLLLAGLVAGGETVVNDVEHIDRGYEAIEAKLRMLGAQIERIKD
ncbi:MAG: UDP-N-acetylglucosamine 1-carboxyvinyltransferase [Candidatus Aminicenantales bacterium]